MTKPGKMHRVLSICIKSTGEQVKMRRNLEHLGLLRHIGLYGSIIYN